MKQVDRDKPQKLYVQAFDMLKEKIESGEWAIGSQIPTEEELCRIFNVSKATIRLAVLELVRQGYLMRQQGKGTFICKRVIPQGLTMSTSFTELMVEAGVDFTTEVLAQTVMMPVDDIDLKLNIPEDKHLIYIKRLRRVDGEPVIVQESYIPHSVCPGLLHEDIAGNSLLELLEKKYDIKISKVQDYMEVTFPAPEDSKLLGLQAGGPALLLEQHFYSGDTQVMYMRSLKRPERFRFFFEFERKA